MPAAKQRARSSSGSSSRGRGTTNGSQRSASRSRSQSGSAKKRSTSNGASAARQTASKTASKASETARQTASKASSNGHSPSTVASIGMSAAAGALGVAGGVLLGRTALQRNRKVLGVKLPVKIDLGDVTQQIGAVGRQFGKLATEVRTVREKAEQVGRAIS